MNIWLIIACTMFGFVIGGIIVWIVMQYLIGKAWMDSM